MKIKGPTFISDMFTDFAIVGDIAHFLLEKKKKSLMGRDSQRIHEYANEKSNAIFCFHR